MNNRPFILLFPLKYHGLVFCQAVFLRIFRDSAQFQSLSCTLALKDKYHFDIGTITGKTRPSGKTDQILQQAVEKIERKSSIS
ncbi:MAG: hypothetical protein A2142_05815 [candidate division Zixibacteria bacterium RBG_16_48_11]|nr:MAG: hypothetical protein A2142_05815 [candidate division Zixibacteria bacterium RBG_16_48_11]